MGNLVNRCPVVVDVKVRGETWPADLINKSLPPIEILGSLIMLHTAAVVEEFLEYSWLTSTEGGTGPGQLFFVNVGSLG